MKLLKYMQFKNSLKIPRVLCLSKLEYIWGENATHVENKRLIKIVSETWTQLSKWHRISVCV